MYLIKTELVDDLYCFLGLNILKLVDSDKIVELRCEVLLQLLSGKYYIDMNEEAVLVMIVDWLNADFKVLTLYMYVVV